MKQVIIKLKYKLNKFDNSKYLSNLNFNFAFIFKSFLKYTQILMIAENTSSKVTCWAKST